MTAPERYQSALSVPACESSQLVYVLSSVYGFGHSSRAVAVAQALEPAQPVTFVARNVAHEFLQTNLGGYGSGLRFVEPDYEKHTPDIDYVRRNQHLAEVIASGKVVINDFHMQMPGLRLLMEQGGVSPPFVGVYHSIDGYESDSVEITEFQCEFRRLAQQLDYLFLVEPKSEHQEPYQLDSGTLVIPCDPVVRETTLDSATVKTQLGLQPEDEFIYVQGGGLTAGKELEQVAKSLQSISLNGLKIVLASFNGLEDTIPGNDVVYCQPRLDGHNVIAASAGVITKPGMGTICETIANRKPLFLVDYPTPEGRAKFAMLRHILGNDLPFHLDVDADLLPQISDWLQHSEEISERFTAVPCQGAKTIAKALATM